MFYCCRLQHSFWYWQFFHIKLNSTAFHEAFTECTPTQYYTHTSHQVCHGWSDTNWWWVEVKGIHNDNVPSFACINFKYECAKQRWIGVDNFVMLSVQGVRYILTPWSVNISKGWTWDTRWVGNSAEIELKPRISHYKSLYLIPCYTTEVWRY